MTGDGADGAADPTPRDRDEDRSDLDVEAAFAQIVAAWSAPAPAGGQPEAQAAAGSPATRGVPWPESEDVADEGEPPARTDVPAGTSADEHAEPGLGSPSWTARSTEDVEREIDRLVDAEQFVPPDPEPIPSGDITTRLSWLAVIGGPVFLVFAALFWHDLPQWLLLSAVAAFVGGFATLVARMPTEHDEDDDGAVV